MTQISPVLTENYGPRDWLSIAKTKSQSLYKVRESALAWWAKANGFQDPELLFSLIKNGEQDPYQAAKNMVDLLTKERAKTTAATYRSVIQTFYKFADIPFKEELFNLKVPVPINEPSVDPEALEPGEIRALLQVLDKTWQALVLFLVNTGWRVSEPFKIQMEEINFEGWPDFGNRPGVVHIRALNEQGEPTNKTRKKLWGFLSDETVKLLRDFRGNYEPEDYLFAETNSDKAYYHLMKGFQEAKLTKRYGYLNKFTVHPHTFRTTNLALAKGSGYDPDYADALVGHAGKIKVSYQNVKKMAGEWLVKVEPNMRFLG